MAAKAEKFVIALQAQYQGDEAISRLQTDLDNLGRVDQLRKWQTQLAEASTAMEQAGAEAARLKTVMDASFDARILNRLDRTRDRLTSLEDRYRRQEEALAGYRSRMDQAGQAVADFSARLSQTPTEQEAARLARLTQALATAEARYERQQAVLAQTGAAVQQTGYQVGELAEALRNSVDPKVQRQYEAQVSRYERQSQAAAGLRTRIEATTASLAEQGIATRNLAATHGQLDAAAQRTGRHLAAMRQLGLQSFSGINAEAQKLKQAWADLDKSNLSLRDRFAHWTTYRERLAEARAQTSGWTEQVHKLQAGWAGVLGVIGGLSLAKVGLHQYADFDDAMMRVQALSRSTGQEFELLKRQAQDLGATTRFTATEAAQGMSELAATGMDAQEIYQTLPAAMDMAAISGMGVKDSADKVTDIMSQFGLETEKAVHVVDVLTQGYTGASTSMEELSQAMVYVGPLAHTVGYSLEQTTAILQALAESGYKGEKAGTALRGGLARLLKPSGAAADVLEKYNIQIQDSSGNMRNFADIMDDLGRSSMSSGEMITLFGQEAGPAMMALLNQGAGALRGFEAKLQDVDGRARGLAEQFESGIGGSLRQLDSSISAIAIAFGDTFAPAVRLTADALSTAARWIAGLPEPIRAVIGVVTAATTAFAMWRMGLGLMAGAMVRFGLDLAAKAQLVWQFATQTVPVWVRSMQLASGSTLGLRAALNSTVGSLPVLGNLLTTSTGQLLTFSSAATKAGAALKLVSAAGLLLAAWEFGRMVGGWLNGFDLVQKAAIQTMEFFHLLGLRAQWAWAMLTGGDAGAISQRIAETKKIYAEMIADIGTTQEEPVKAAADSQEAITEKTRAEAAKQVAIAQQAAAEMTAAYDSVAEPGKSGKEKKHWYEDWYEQTGKALDPTKRPEQQGRRRVVDAAGKWRYAYTDAADEALAAKPVQRRIVSHKHGWSQVFEDGQLAKTVSNAEAAALMRDSKRQLARQAEAKIAAAVPPMPQQPRARDEEETKPSRVVELRLGKAKLTGAGADVDDFIRQLEQAGLRA